MKKQIFITLLFLILLAGIVYCASPAITHYGLQIFPDGIRIGTDPNNAWLSNGNITAKTIYSNGSITATLDANSHVADSAVYDKHTNLTSSLLGLGVAVDPNYSIKVGANKFTVDPNGSITAGKTVTIDGLTIQAKSGALADDGTIVLPTGVCGILKVWSEAEHGEFFIKADGTIEYIRMTTNVDDVATDGYLCVVDAGSGGSIINKLGSEKKIRYTFEYSTE